MKHKVGDTIRIKSLDWYNENKDKNGVVIYPVEYNDIMTKAMSIYCGKTAKIVDITNSDCYKLDVDHKKWNWNDWMFDEDFYKTVFQDFDGYEKSIKNLCSNFCYMECNENCPLFKFKDLLTKLYKKS